MLTIWYHAGSLILLVSPGLGFEMAYTQDTGQVLHVWIVEGVSTLTALAVTQWPSKIFLLTHTLSVTSVTSFQWCRSPASVGKSAHVLCRLKITMDAFDFLLPVKMMERLSQ